MYKIIKESSLNIIYCGFGSLSFIFIIFILIKFFKMTNSEKDLFLDTFNIFIIIVTVIVILLVLLSAMEINYQRMMRA